MLGFEEAFSVPAAAGQRIFLKINDDQFIVLEPGLKPSQDNRLAWIAIQSSDVRRLHGMLANRGLRPSQPQQLDDGTSGFWLSDPDGTHLLFVQYLPGSLQARSRGKHLGSKRISQRLWHAGVIVSDLAKSMAFYGDKLGLRETWRGGPTDQELRWINMEMPGRGDYLEFMLYKQPPTRQQLGSMQHACLLVPDIHAAYRQALAQGLPDEERFRARVGRNGRWLANLFDPDGSRTELMEPTPAR